MLNACDEFTDALEDFGFAHTAIYDQVVLTKTQLTLFLQQCNLAMLAVQFRLQQLITRANGLDVCKKIQTAEEL